MIKSFKLPDLGEGIHEGEVMNIPVSKGDQVTEGDVIIEVETDKAAVEIPSPFTGTIKEIRVKKGDVVHVEDVLMTFEVAGDAAEDSEASKEKEKSDQKDTTARKDESEKKDADSTSEDEKRDADAGERPNGPVPASPATRRLAREKGVDLRAVTPTGRGGVVTADDVRAFVEKGKAEPEETPSDAEPETDKTPSREGRPISAEALPLPDFSKWGPVERQSITSVRRAIARQMSLAWSQIPHITSSDTADVTDLEAFRQKHKAAVEKQGGRLTMTVFALKAAVTALKAHPKFNASLDAEAGELILKQYYHVGVAVDTDDGLIVPVIRDVDRKSLTELAIELKELAEKTRDRKVPMEQLRGGTFTITNMGAMGGDHFTPIINHPDVAILGLGRAKRQPTVREIRSGRTEIVPRLLMPVVLGLDHRVLDGGDSARFMKTIIDALEDPEHLMLTMA